MYPACFGVYQAREGINIGRLELGQLAVLQNEFYYGMNPTQLFQN